MKKDISDQALYKKACEAREASYSPYSGISVGAALLTKSGKIYTGANVENSAFSPSVCAERVAIFKAINDGEREFSKIAVAGGKAGEGEKSEFPPCGVCRQVMAEFCKEDLQVILSEKRSVKFSELLPFGFKKELLK
jgi:cytidine deaminase